VATPLCHGPDETGRDAEKPDETGRDMDEKKLGRIKRFLWKYADSLRPVCLNCLTEFAHDTERCLDCDEPLTDGLLALVTLLTVVDPTLVDEAKEKATLMTGDHSGDEPGDRECPRCGRTVDTQTGACEDCLLDMVRDGERLEGNVEPEASERNRVATLQTFFKADHDASRLYCPGCLAALSVRVQGCEECNKGAMTLSELEEHLKSEIHASIGDWFVPIADDANAEFVEELIGLLANNLSDRPIPSRLLTNPLNFNPIFGHWTRRSRVLFILRKDAPRLLDLLAGSELETSFAMETAALRIRLKAVASAEFDDVWCVG